MKKVETNSSEAKPLPSPYISFLSLRPVRLYLPFFLISTLRFPRLTNFPPVTNSHLDNAQGRQERLTLDYTRCHIYAVDEMIVLDKNSTVLDTTGVVDLVILQQPDRTTRKKAWSIWECGSGGNGGSGGGELLYDLSAADPELEGGFWNYVIRARD
jgi:hypothetical protein